MTTQQVAPPAPLVAPYVPSWGLYIYGTHAFFTYDGRLIAEATVATPAQDAHIARLFQRLTTQHTPRKTTFMSASTHDRPPLQLVSSQDKQPPRAAGEIPESHRLSTPAENLAFARTVMADVARAAQEHGPGWVESLLATWTTDTNPRALCMLFAVVLSMNADAIEAHMARTDAPGLRLV